MDIGTVLRSLLVTDPAIVAVVGTRVYPIKAPQSPTYPLITYQQISGVRETTLHGRAGLARPRFQIDAWYAETGTGYKLSRALGALILARLEGLTTRVADPDVPSETRIVAVTFDSDQDLFEQDTNGGFYRHSADYFVMYQTGHGSGT